MIHPLSDVKSTKIGENTNIWQFCVVFPEARIGSNCNVCANVLIENDVIVGDNVTVKSGVQLWDGVTLEDNVFIGPNVTFTNNRFPRSKEYPKENWRTVVKKGASLGANTTVVAGITIGERALVGAGSVVTKDIPAHSVWYGNPARLRGYVNENDVLVPIEKRKCENNMVKFLDLQKITMQHADEYKAAANRVIESGWFLQGNENKLFETDYAKYTGTSECIAVANGLDALYFIMRGYIEMGVMQEGDEIIVPANTYIATILAITKNNLVPVLIEPLWSNLEIDIDKIEEAITSKTKGVMIVHLYGRIAYNDKLGIICKEHNLRLMEDCAQSHGCAWKGIKTGALGDAAAHSFYPGKNLGAFGDAGAVTTSDLELASVIRALANYGSQKKYVFKYVGMNSRMSELDAAILDVKLKYLDEDNAKRQELAAYYYENIKNPLITLPARIPNENNVYHQFPILCERRDELQEFLKNNGVQTLIHYPIPPHKQECYKDWNDCVYPITEKIHKQELSIPMNQVVTMEEAKVVVDVINLFK